MRDSTAANPCADCGATIPADAPESQCPRCLMAQIIEPTELDDHAPKVPVLTPEELAPHFPQLEILECLGRGGMGVVYKARQKSLNRLVALKLLAPERANDPQFALRFEKEAPALAALNHPNIVAVHDFGQAGGFYFLLMEFVDGVNLRQLLQTKRLTPKEALSIVSPVCDALQCAHDHGIVHRDIKPENLLIDKNGTVKIADFGIAKMYSSPLAPQEEQCAAAEATGPRTSETPSSGESPQLISRSEMATIGTPDYAAPEQANGTADHRADIYSLGVVLYEMLTGERPKEHITPPSRRVQVDIRIDEIVLKALEKTPELRFATAAEFRTQVEAATVTGPTSMHRPQLLILAACLALVGALALGWALRRLVPAAAIETVSTASPVAPATSPVPLIVRPKNQTRSILTRPESAEERAYKVMVALESSLRISLREPRVGRDGELFASSAKFEPLNGLERYFALNSEELVKMSDVQSLKVVQDESSKAWGFELGLVADTAAKLEKLGSLMQGRELVVIATLHRGTISFRDPFAFALVPVTPELARNGKLRIISPFPEQQVRQCANGYGILLAERSAMGLENTSPLSIPLRYILASHARDQVLKEHPQFVGSMIHAHDERNIIVLDSSHPLAQRVRTKLEALDRQPDRIHFECAVSAIVMRGGKMTERIISHPSLFGLVAKEMNFVILSEPQLRLILKATSAGSSQPQGTISLTGKLVESNAETSDTERVTQLPQHDLTPGKSVAIRHRTQVGTEYEIKLTPRLVEDRH